MYSEKQIQSWEQNGIARRLSQDSFIEKSRSIHGDLYDYSKTIYVKNKDKVDIICNIHGIFSQSPDKHTRGRGCPRCAQIKRNANKKYSKLDFQSLANNTHSNYYDYSKLENNELSLCNNKISIICPIHGEFEQWGADHLRGHGCRQCFKDDSKIETTINDFLEELNVTYLRRDRKILNGKELDFYIPSKNLAIEVNGLYWHSELAGKCRNYHLNKTELTKSNGVFLIHLFEDEIYNKLDIIKSIIKSKLNVDTKSIGARKCKISEVSVKEKSEFLNKNHVQGNDRSTFRYGLYYDEELVSVMTFSHLRICNSSSHQEGIWELSRFANKLDHRIMGGFSKLMHKFIKENSPTKIISYADKRISTGDVYIKNGFKLDWETKPSYFYFNSHIKRHHRFNFRKSVLKNKLEIFDPNLSEWDNMKLNNWNRIFDCGSYRFSYIL